MKPQVDRLQLLESYLDRRAATCADLLQHDCFMSRDDLLETVRAYGGKITQIDGEEWVIKNNSQRERVVADKAAMEFFLSRVVPGGPIWSLKGLEKAVRIEGLLWSAFKRVAVEMGYYLVWDSEMEAEVLKFVGFEMDFDLRIRVCRALREAMDSGIDVDSELAFQVVQAAEVRPVSVRDYELCVELTKNQFVPSEVESN